MQPRAPQRSGQSPRFFSASHTARRLPTARSSAAPRLPRRTCSGLATVLALSLWAPLPAFAQAEPCPNAQIRAEQPYAQQLPDCRAYELVSPLDTDGQDAILAEAAFPARAATSGEAITYASRGLYGEPTGGAIENQYVSRRGSTRWSTKSVTPLHDPEHTEPLFAYEGAAFNPELTEGITATNAPLVEGAPGGKEEAEFGLYVADFESGSYRYIAPGERSFGASRDLTRVVFGDDHHASYNGEIFESDGSAITDVDVGNEGEQLSGAVGVAAPNSSYSHFKNVWHAVSDDATRVYFTTPDSVDQSAVARLMVRVNIGQPQSPLAEPEASGTGTLTAGSHLVSSLLTTAGFTHVEANEGSTTLPVDTVVGRFVVGQSLRGNGIAPGTTVTAVSGSTLTLSLPLTVTIGGGTAVSSSGPTPFFVGQRVSGNGIPQGTAITAIASGSLTLSNPAASSGTAVALSAGGGCTAYAAACTIDVSASQRLKANPAGNQPARYWGASEDGSHVFFTSAADLTEDAYTGPTGTAPNLYEYRLPSAPDQAGTLRDLTVTEADNGAAVLGVVQISEDGSRVYFVAEGKLANGATQGAPNLYAVEDGGPPSFIATLSRGDESDWHGGNRPVTEAGPQVNTAVVNPSGTRLAFLSASSLTGYDDEQARAGECEGTANPGACPEVFLYDAENGGLACASCNPSGAPPTGPSGLGRSLSKAISLYRPRNLLNDGALFFESVDELVAGATAGHRNVYEYESGRIVPLSDVTGGYDSTFLDASPSGQDVFIATADQLLGGQPTENNVAVYDARTNGGYPEPPTSGPCAGAEACLPPESAQPSTLMPEALMAPDVPSAPTALSAAPRAGASPAGNPRAKRLALALKACKRFKVKKRRLGCERAARRRLAPTAPRNAGTAAHKRRQPNTDRRPR